MLVAGAYTKEASPKVTNLYQVGRGVLSKKKNRQKENTGEGSVKVKSLERHGGVCAGPSER